MGSELTSDNFVRVEVVDTGIGISEENVNKLFKGAMQIEAHGLLTTEEKSKLFAFFIFLVRSDLDHFHLIVGLL